MTSKLMRVLVVLACGIAAVGLDRALVITGHAESDTPSALDGSVETVRRLAAMAVPLRSYRARRTLEATARGGAVHASLSAWTTLDPEGRFHFDVIDEEGSSLIRKRVLRAALDAEQRLIGTGESTRGAISEANYTFSALAPLDDGTTRIAMVPRRRDTLLLDGALFVSPGTYELQRVEGRLAQRPSFWTRSVNIVREYEIIDGVRVPVRMRSIANVLVVGRSTFAMTWDYVSINGVPVTPTPIE